MTEKTPRREFIKLTLATSCLSAISYAALGSDKEKQDLSCEERIKKKQDETWAWGLKQNIQLLAELKKKFGVEVAEITRQHTAGNIEKQYTEMKIEKRDLQAVKKLLWETLPEGDFEFRKVSDTEEHLEFRVTRCKLAEMLHEYNEPELGYALVCAWDEGFCRGVNPEMKFTRTKTLMMGDKYCNHTYELKKV
jgi:hypothetical protein